MAGMMRYALAPAAYECRGQGARDQSSTPSTSSITASCRCEGRRPMFADFVGVFVAISLVMKGDVVSLVGMSCRICKFEEMWCTTCRWESAGQRAIVWQGLGMDGAALQPHRWCKVQVISLRQVKAWKEEKGFGFLIADD